MIESQPLAGCYDLNFRRISSIPGGAENGKCLTDRAPVRFLLRYRTTCPEGKPRCTYGSRVQVIPETSLDGPQPFGDGFNLNLTLGLPIVLGQSVSSFSAKDACVFLAGQAGGGYAFDEATQTCQKKPEKVCEELGWTYHPTLQTCLSYASVECESGCGDPLQACEGYTYAPPGKSCVCRGKAKYRDLFGAACSWVHVDFLINPLCAMDNVRNFEWVAGDYSKNEQDACCQKGSCASSINNRDYAKNLDLGIIARPSISSYLAHAPVGVGSPAQKFCATQPTSPACRSVASDGGVDPTGSGTPGTTPTPSFTPTPTATPTSGGSGNGDTVVLDPKPVSGELKGCVCAQAGRVAGDGGTLQCASSLVNDGVGNVRDYGAITCAVGNRVSVGGASILCYEYADTVAKCAYNGPMAATDPSTYLVSPKSCYCQGPAIDDLRCVYTIEERVGGVLKRSFNETQYCRRGSNLTLYGATVSCSAPNTQDWTSCSAGTSGGVVVGDNPPKTRDCSCYREGSMGGVCGYANDTGDGCDVGVYVCDQSAMACATGPVRPYCENGYAPINIPAPACSGAVSGGGGGGSGGGGAQEVEQSL